MLLIGIMSLFFLAFMALITFLIFGVPLLIWLGKALCVLVGGFFEWAASAIKKAWTDAAIARKVKAGMTPEEALEALEREWEERTRREMSPGHIALVSAAFLLVILLVGAADHLLGPRPEPSTPAHIEIRPSIPEVGMAVSELDDTDLGDWSRAALAQSAIGSDGTVVDVDYVYVWEASNGSHDPMLTVYVRDGVAVAVERCNVDVYWRDSWGYPNRFAKRPEGYVPDEVTEWEAPAVPGAQNAAGDADASSVDADGPSGDDGQASGASDADTAAGASEGPADTHRRNTSVPLDPLDYDSAEEYADDAEEWFRDQGSDDPYGDALEYWEDNGP